MEQKNKATENVQVQTGADVLHEYLLKEEKCVVIRHFAGDKNLESILMELAVNRAKHEIGL